jgi:hypothetical protein
MVALDKLSEDYLLTMALASHKSPLVRIFQ